TFGLRCSSARRTCAPASSRRVATSLPRPPRANGERTPSTSTTLRSSMGSLLLGDPLYHAGVQRVAGLFLRSLGAVYLCAFASLWVQLAGLIGAQGIAPARALLELARERLGSGAPLALPTLLWLTGGADWALHGLCALGVAAALALVAGRASFWAALAAWLAYLSLVCVGDVFLSFQWDMLLLEAGLVALLAASREPRLGVWLARALL